MSLYEFEWPATDEHLIAIGKIAIESASVEQTLQLAIWQILGVPEEKGSYVTGHLRLDSRLILFQDIAPSYFPKSAHCKLKKKINAIRKANTERNRIIHGLWEHGKDSPAKIHKYKKAKGEYELRYKIFTAEQLEKIATQIFDAHNGLILLMNQHGLVPPERPNKPSRPY